MTLEVGEATDEEMKQTIETSANKWVVIITKELSRGALERPLDNTDYCWKLTMIMEKMLIEAVAIGHSATGLQLMRLVELYHDVNTIYGVLYWETDCSVANTRVK